MPQKGMFISLEGIEGAGKSTHMPALVDLLESHKIPCLATREPGGTEFGEHVREILLSKTQAPASVEAELLLIFAARAEHVHTRIKPALEAGSWVLTDRFLDASFAYQGAGQGLGVDRVEQLAQWLLPDLRPDLVIVLDTSVETALERVQRRGQKKDRYEENDLEFFTRARQCYLDQALSQPDRYRVVDAERPVDEVHAELLEILRSLI